jgi:hypothetical protein
MADNFRSRDPQRAGAADSLSDPLAELARLIGERAPRAADRGDALREAERYDDTPPTSGVEWIAGEDAYAEPARDSREAYAAPSSDGVAWTRERDLDDRHAGPPPARQYADPALPFDDFADHDEQRASAFDAPSPRYESPQHEPYPPDDHALYAGQEQDDRDPAEEEYEHDSRAPRRSGTILILAVLGLAVLGTAGAFGYKAMFGNSMVSGFVPLIKPDDKPIKIQPSQDKQAGKPSQSETADKGAGERLVDHQEQPIDVQSANPPVPRVVNTIPAVPRRAAACRRDAGCPTAAANGFPGRSGPAACCQPACRAGAATRHTRPGLGRSQAGAYGDHPARPAS